jgi:adenylylsulfate kinase-like enzyme
MIIWITGNSGAGKSTLAKKLKTEKSVILDGDELRQVWNDFGFDESGRTQHCMRVARLAKIFHEQGYDVIIAVICPFRKLRKEIDDFLKPRWIYLHGGKEVSAEYPYEIDFL